MLSEFYITNQLLQSEFNCENIFIKLKITQKTPKIGCILHGLDSYCILEKIGLPLWCSIIYEKMELGKIFAPKWLNSKWLGEKVFSEIDKEYLQIIPRNYIEILYTIHKNKLNFLNLKSTLLVLIEDIFSTRINKITMGLICLRVSVRALKLENIAEVELINYREILKIQLEIINFTNFSLKNI
jgi:hypothetical protein